LNDPARRLCLTEELRSYAHISGRAEDSLTHATLAHAVRLYPTAIKAWALGALCDFYRRQFNFYRRQFNQELDWCERQEKLSLKGVEWTGSHFGNRTKRQAIAYKRGIKADRAITRELPFQANRLIRAPVSFDTQGRQGKGRPVNGTCRKNGSTPQGGMATRLPHAETQNTRRARSSDSWIHLEGHYA
jgi:hypothetical protein